MIGILPLIFMHTLIIEYFETGQWVWNFDRDYFRLSDILEAVMLFLGFFGIFYYPRWHFVNDKQTLGQHLFKFKLIPMETNTSFAMRAFVAWANLAWCPIWPWTIMKRQQDYWWGTASKIKARRVTKI